MPQSGLFAGLVVQNLSEVDGRLLISQRTVEGRGPPGRQRDQRTVAGGSRCLDALIRTRPTPWPRYWLETTTSPARATGPLAEKVKCPEPIR
jgi:hypothetical protein